MAVDPRFPAVWGPDELFAYPRDKWIADGVPAAALPDGDEIPLEVTVVYTAFLDGEIGMFDILHLTGEDSDLDIKLTVVGAVAENHNLLYVLDQRTGEVLQFDLEEQDIQAVNSSFRQFVEFLWKFALFVEADEGKQGRRERALRLSGELRAIDPQAFEADAWWPLVIDQTR
ncbi:SUKH-4 family immunity protein [Actinoplanes subglobosus]|uniref:SUKH-4 family immunity protein n=1 Tax=Actinoplanes subglobosus TaxID=1547892 RepID=A0ABV8IYD3_9ACTN